jgi:hypothetical protein
VTWLLAPARTQSRRQHGAWSVAVALLGDLPELFCLRVRRLGWRPQPIDVGCWRDNLNYSRNGQPNWLRCARDWVLSIIFLEKNGKSARTLRAGGRS